MIWEVFLQKIFDLDLVGNLKERRFEILGIGREENCRFWESERKKFWLWEFEGKNILDSGNWRGRTRQNLGIRRENILALEIEREENVRFWAPEKYFSVSGNCKGSNKN